MDLLILLNRKIYEPTPRLHDTFGYKYHRFEIKNGISTIDVMRRQLASPNSLLAKLKEKGLVKK